MAGDGSDVTQLDALVAVMCVFCVLHARSAAEDGLGGGWRLLLASAMVGLITEFGAIRFGGTHCHHGSAYANFAVCSSANSVLYYMPWIYSCVVSAVRLTGCDGEGGARWALPWITGALTFGMCGVYEMQGAWAMRGVSGGSSDLPLSRSPIRDSSLGGPNGLCSTPPQARRCAGGCGRMTPAS